VPPWAKTTSVISAEVLVQEVDELFRRELLERL